MSDIRALLRRTAELASDFIESLDDRPVFPRMSGTTWNGQRSIRVSVSNWQTDDDEIDLALEAFRTASQSPAHAPAR
jgi:hypothetical protein